MNNPLVSVIIPVYRVEKYIRTCLDSVLNQSYTNWEMILVDDGSPDRSGEICDEYAERDQRITVVHKQNGGQSSARNAALDLPPRGEFVTFLDSDDFWHKDYLKSLVKGCVEYDAEMSQCWFISGTETSFPEILFTHHYDIYDNHSVFLNRKANVLMWGKLYRLSLFDGIRMPVGLYNEDDWTAWKLYYRAKKIVVTNDKYYYYTKNPNSTMGNLKRKPDLRFLNAYNERIVFFKEKGETDLEHISRWQVCKSLVLTYSHPTHTKEDRKKIWTIFTENWMIIKQSPYIPVKYKLIYTLFSFSPSLFSWLLSRLRGNHYKFFKRFT